MCVCVCVYGLGKNSLSVKMPTFCDERAKRVKMSRLDLGIRRLSVAVVSVGDPTAGPAVASFLRGRPGGC